MIKLAPEGSDGLIKLGFSYPGSPFTGFFGTYTVSSESYPIYGLAPKMLEILREFVRHEVDISGMARISVHDARTLIKQLEAGS